MAAGACDTCGSWGCAGNHEPTITATRAEIEAALREAMSWRLNMAAMPVDRGLVEDYITAALARLTEEPQ